MPDELYLLLESYNANALREMAEANDLKTVADSGRKLPKLKLLQKMRDEFFTGKRVLASWNRLDKVEQAVLNRLLLRGGQVAKQRFEREIVRAGLATKAPEPERASRYYYSPGAPYADGYAGKPGRIGSTIFEDVIARLTYRGLLFSRNAELSTGGTVYKLRFHPAAELFIPQVIQDILPTPDPVIETNPEYQPLETLNIDPALFLRDMYLYWDFVRQNNVDILASGFAGKRSLKAINDVLLVSDPLLADARREDQTGRLYLLRQLLEKTKLVRAQQNKFKPTIKNPLKIPPFWQKPQTEQISEILAHWQKLSGFKDFTSDQLKEYGANFTKARQVILDALKSLRSNRWLDPNELLEEIQFSSPDFLFPERSLVENAGNRSYYHSRYGTFYFYGKPKTLLDTFDKLELQTVSACISGYLFLLGLVELGRLEKESAASRPWSVFRLTPLGLHIFKKQKAPPTLEHSGKLLVQPNFQVMAIGPVPLNTLAQLDLFATRTQVDQGAFQYRLSRESVYQAQQSGLSTAEIIKILLQESGQNSLPQNVQRSLEEWGSHHERIVFRQGVSLLQTANGDLLNRLLAEASTAKFLARPVTEDVALVSSKKQDKLVKALMAQSLLPAVSGANPQAADQSVLVQDNGVIEPVHAVPSLHLRGRLAPLAQEGDDGRWRLTPASIRKSGGSKPKVVKLLAQLEKLHRGKLPEPVVVRVKKWGGYYGKAAVQTVTLLEFSDRDIMNELLKSERLKDKITPFHTNDRALVIVAAEHLKQVTAELSDLGIPVKEGLLSG